jgi:hypothetical protein
MFNPDNIIDNLQVSAIRGFMSDFGGIWHMSKNVAVHEICVTISSGNYSEDGSFWLDVTDNAFTYTDTIYGKFIKFITGTCSFRFSSLLNGEIGMKGFYKVFSTKIPYFGTELYITKTDDPDVYTRRSTVHGVENTYNLTRIIDECGNRTRHYDQYIKEVNGLNHFTRQKSQPVIDYIKSPFITLANIVATYTAIIYTRFKK